MKERFTNLWLKVVLGENHHLLIVHLGEKRCIFMKAETFQPPRNIYSKHIQSHVRFRIISPQLLALHGFQQSQMTRVPLALVGNELWPFMPLPSSWKVLRAEPCSSVCSLPWGGDTALGWKRCMICWHEVLSHVILAHPLRATSLGTGRNNGHGLLQRAGAASAHPDLARESNNELWAIMKKYIYSW